MSFIRKLCLRLLKCLFEGLKQTYPKELDPLCSYHGKTAFFYTLCERFEDSMWTPDQLSVCFMNLLGHFERAVNDGTLPHFFVPNYNLFSPSSFNKRSLQFLSKALREQRETGLPLLQVLDRVPIPSPQISPEPATVTLEACESSSFRQTAFMLSLTCAVIFWAIMCAVY